MNELFRDEIYDQPRALRDSLLPLRQQFSRLDLSASGYQRVFLGGCGDGAIAPLAMKMAFQSQLELDINPLPAMEISQYTRLRATDLVVAISISGKVRRIIEAAQTAKAAGASIMAITGNGSSPLAQNSNMEIEIPILATTIQTPHAINFLATLLALSTLLEKMAGKSFIELDRLPGIIQATINGLVEPCFQAAKQIAKSNIVYFLGAGPHWGMACYGAAKFWSAGGMRAFAFELEDFAHGAHLTLSHRDPVIVLAPEGRSLARAVEIVAGLVKLDAQVYVITNRPESFSAVPVLCIPLTSEKNQNADPVVSQDQSAEIWTPFISAIPLQLLCMEVATNKGYDVIEKTGRIENLAVYDRVHREWAYGSALHVRDAS
jgi:fructoselysine-6-P-deglycase FrlB-like protein